MTIWLVNFVVVDNGSTLDGGYVQIGFGMFHFCNMVFDMIKFRFFLSNTKNNTGFD